MTFTLNKKEKLKSKKRIDLLFAEGQSVSTYPLRLVFLEMPSEDTALTKTGFSVSKRHFKKAVDRNRIKRLLREVYRLNKGVYFKHLPAHYAFMVLYVGKEMPSISLVESHMTLLFKKFKKSLSEN